MMITGELNFNDIMYSNDQAAYYQLGYVMFLLFALCMTVLTTNILIGMRFFLMIVLFSFFIQNRPCRR
jgi:hypothetical protein